jgi:protocatechuate 3,4-dioxygenase beta subunit
MKMRRDKNLPLWFDEFMQSFNIYLPRREFIRSAALTAAFLTSPGAFAEALIQTPKQTEGPFYPDHLPLDTDNDLIIVNNSLTPAVGEITYLSGRVLDASGSPVRGALVEIWQCDSKGVYLHSKSSGKKPESDRDVNFQSFGRFLTGSKGEYLFRTIKPVPYAGRTPHIHFKVKAKGKELLTTQCYIKGFAGNEKDGIWRGIKDEKARDSVTIDFTPMPESEAAELTAKFDIVLGFTPEG